MMAPSSFQATLPPSSAADEATLPIQTQACGQLAPSARSPGNDWPLALCTGGYERGPARLKIKGKRPLTGEDRTGQRWEPPVRLAGWHRTSNMKEQVDG